MQPEHVLKLVVLTDFDGTATGVGGQDLVFSDFYKSLQQDPSSNEYQTTPFKESDTIQEIFKNTFKDRSDPRLLSESAEKYFRLLLDNPAAKLCIITQNRISYIQEILKYHGFTETQINKIHIKDSGDKQKDATEFLGENEAHLNHAITTLNLLDDNSTQLALMLMAVGRHTVVNIANSSVYNEKPGDFNATWAKLTEEIPLSNAQNSQPRFFKESKPILNQKPDKSTAPSLD